MSQNDLVIANQSFPATRADINSALQALGSLNSGSTAPATTYANMLWYDTTNNTLKMRSEADDVWIEVGYVNQSTDEFSLFDDTKVVNSSGTQTGLIGDQATSAWEAGTSTLESLVSPAKVKASVEAFSSPSFGEGQYWQDVTSSRVRGVTYQNTTGRPIQVSIRLGTGGFTSASSSFVVSSTLGGSITLSTSNIDVVTTHSAIIPDGHGYGIFGTLDPSSWAELR